MYKVLAVLAIGAIALGAWWYGNTTTQPKELGDAPASMQIPARATAVIPGTYLVNTGVSTIGWSVGKPLIDGYINRGSIALSEGSIKVADSGAVGNFVIDMNTIAVGATPKKPGKETLLEEHLKGKNFFDVGTYPTATFTISSVEGTPESAETLIYTVRGLLEMKGVSAPVTFPATIYLLDGALHADASFAIDRTIWGITAGSNKFFENLADNVIEDEIHLTLTVTANQ